MKKYALALALVSSTAALSTPLAHADIATQGRLERSIEFTVDAKGPDITAVSLRRDKLKGTSKTQGDFNLSNRFSFEIDGVLVSGINSIEGIQHETDVVEYHDGDDGVIRVRPPNHNPSRMMVTKDWSNTSEFLKWRKAVLDGKVDRKSISVIFHNDAGEEVGRLQAEGCLPLKIMVSESPFERDNASRQESVSLECVSIQLKTKHDAAMAAIQNTR